MKIVRKYQKEVDGKGELCSSDSSAPPSYAPPPFIIKTL